MNDIIDITIFILKYFITGFVLGIAVMYCVIGIQSLGTWRQQKKLQDFADKKNNNSDIR